ncbi:MAG: presenilin family intramembrane aspartyl protease [Patescibacteria group bacterium]
MKKLVKVFLIEFIFFLATLLLGILVTIKLEDIFQITEAATKSSGDLITPLGFIVYFVIATLVVYLISKSKRLEKGRLLLFKITFLFSVFLGGLVTLSTITFELFSLVLIISLLILWSKKPIILLHNLLVVISIAGIGAIIGREFEPLVIAVFLALFSIYDFVAVYKTKHMVKMATEMIKTKAIMGLIIPFSFSGLLDNLEDKNKKEFMVLGGGDLAFPLFLVSSITLTYGVKEALFLVFFSSLGLFISFYLFLSQKKQKPIPALPPIALSSLIGYLLLTLI